MLTLKVYKKCFKQKTISRSFCLLLRLKISVCNLFIKKIWFLRYYRARSFKKSRCGCAISFLNFWLDRNGNGGGIILFIHDDIPAKPINSQMKVGGFFIELNLRRKKWHLCCSCNPNSQISYRKRKQEKILMF